MDRRAVSELSACAQIAECYESRADQVGACAPALLACTRCCTLCKYVRLNVWAMRWCSRRAGRLQAPAVMALYSAGVIATEDRNMLAVMIDGLAAEVKEVEALPQEALRRAHPRERCMEDARLERHELIVGCWASG